jgi:hypothetical protein
MNADNTIYVGIEVLRCTYSSYNIILIPSVPILTIAYIASEHSYRTKRIRAFALIADV